jgi:biotin---protein ligase
MRLPMQVTVCGLSASGYLLGKDAEGRVHELHPDGNSLDMMKGLIRRKA